ncbi:glyoxalase [Tenacibaculum sp. SG-28]|uniref:glyoxalase n=1 Tax=Tenacibaculum sp. SG-28 TaxID=754426 RepID=UPI000CF3E088|nr:glyoxalase [Tenacibaculum sp. SG-28]PQJ23334.1 hypothetical protein BSU00_03825 [Tenacibaculum sp. SG-28]
MKDRKLTIRPQLELDATGPDENFQNTTLRPILKLQHDLILRLILREISKHKIELTNFTSAQLSIKLTTILSKNIPFRNQYLGIVIGQFTLQEYDEYSENPSEFNKRIIGMLKQRILDSKEELILLSNSCE